MILKKGGTGNKLRPEVQCGDKRCECQYNFVLMYIWDEKIKNVDCDFIRTISRYYGVRLNEFPEEDIQLNLWFKIWHN